MKDNALYLEVDEDITSAIDKLSKLSSSSVQIVVPKRSALLQSIINLKLLKKAAADSGKELVLVTGDRIATDLAARVGLAVAPSLGAKAVVGEAAKPAPAVADDVIEESDPVPPPLEPAVVASPVPAKPATPKRPLFARREVTDEPPASPAADAPAAAASAEGGADTPGDPGAKPAGPSLPKIKVPNFDKLQHRLAWLGLAAVLIVGYLVAMHFYTKATVTLFAAGTKVAVDTTIAADPMLASSDLEKGVLAAKPVVFSKDLSAPFTATGQKDAGTKAHGTITVSNCPTNPQPLVAGTRFVAPDGKVFRSDADTTVPAASYPVGVCVAGKASVNVTADANGDSYNEAPADYTIPALNIGAVTAHGGQMSGGTSKVVSVVSQADVDAAKTALLGKDSDASAGDLAGRVPSGYLALTGSVQQTADNVTPNPAVGEEATTGTLSLKVSYSELAVLKADYEDLLKAREQAQIGDQNQIYDDGLATAKLEPGDRTPDGRQNFHLTTDAYGGAKLSQADVATKLKGKRYGDAIDTATKLPGVQRAEITLWPVWATGVPGRTSQITVVIKVAGAQDK
ncbi:MAG TPA: hypothetical protein VLF67_00325 [Candidatus Saccharimonas sp.]|nr:hypothetical protein [Candidatus Saccharimonas sp.]